MQLQKTLNILSILFCILSLSHPAGAETQSKDSVSGIASSSTTVSMYNEECSSPLPPWPLSNLSTKEKEARLRFFLGNLKWIDDSFEKMGDEKHCAPLLSRLKTLDPNVKILDIIHTGLKDIATCKNLQDMTRYYNFSFDLVPSLLPANKADTSLSPEEKEKKYDVFERRTTKQHTEYYDLSKYFGVNSYGMLGDAVAAHLKPDYLKQFCYHGNDAYFRGRPLVRVFNTDTCAAYFVPFGGAQRLNGVGDSAEPNSSFSSFIEIDGKPYLFRFKGPEWNDFANILNPSNISHKILLIPLEDPKTLLEPVSSTNVCAYKADMTSEGYARAWWKKLKLDDYFEK